MNTRHAPEGAPVSFERYMSSPEFAELRGIPGTAVAAKAQLYSGQRERSLLFFLQSVSMQPRGLQCLAGEIIRTYKLADSENEVASFLVELCINPKVSIQFDKSSVTAAARDYQRRHESALLAGFAMTSLARQVFETMNYSLDTTKMSVIEGNSGTGKSTAVEAWAAAHQGVARLVSLSGINHRTSFFRKLASAIGLAAAKRKPTDMQVKVEEFFRRTKVLLAIDEAHYLWPQQQQIYCRPELIDWVNTALVNHGLPVVLICTDQFAKLKRRVEKQTGWTGEQFEHRVKRYVKLPALPTQADLELVASKLLRARWCEQACEWTSTNNSVDPNLIGAVVGYALTCKLRLPAVADLVREARLVAIEKGRAAVTASDLKHSLLSQQLPSDQAMREAFEPVPVVSAGRAAPEFEASLHASCNGSAKSCPKGIRSSISSKIAAFVG